MNPSRYGPNGGWNGRIRWSDRAIGSWPGRSPRSEEALRTGAGLVLDLQRDHAVLVAAAAVDHRRPAVGLFDEQIEVVPDQLHLVERLVERHRSRDVRL